MPRSARDPAGWGASPAPNPPGTAGESTFLSPLGELISFRGCLMAVSRVNPHRLGTRGLKLWKSIATGQKLSEIETQNLVEACRIADRLEKLDELIRGDEDAWFRLKLPRTDDGVVEVLINDPMKEARMHAAALRQLIAPFEAAKSDEGTKEVPSNVANIKEALTRKGGAAARPKRSTK